MKKAKERAETEAEVDAGQISLFVNMIRSTSRTVAMQKAMVGNEVYRGGRLSSYPFLEGRCFWPHCD